VVYTGSLNLEIRQNTSLEIGWRQERVACIYENSQSIVEDPPDALNAQRRKGCSHTDSNQEPHHSSEDAGSQAANKQTGAGRRTPAATPAIYFQTTSQRRKWVLKRSLCRWQLQALQTGFSSMA